jgi:hypothetical protein
MSEPLTAPVWHLAPGQWGLRRAGCHGATRAPARRARRDHGRGEARTASRPHTVRTRVVPRAWAAARYALRDGGALRAVRRDRFCEVFGADGPRSHYARLVERLDALSSEDMAARVTLVESILRRQGITFAVYGEAAGSERTWPLDLVPRLIPSAEWDHLERGLAQRVRALNAFLEDLYVGGSAAVRDGIIPAWLVESSPGYVREALGVHVPFGARCIVSGIDLVRDAEGVYRVLEDNLRVPSGVAYVLENRVAMARALSVAFEGQRVRPVNHYGASLLRTLCEVAPRGVSDPTVVVLTPGVFNSAHFEHVFLRARWAWSSSRAAISWWRTRASTCARPEASGAWTWSTGESATNRSIRSSSGPIRCWACPAS